MPIGKLNILEAEIKFVGVHHKEVNKRLEQEEQPKMRRIKIPGLHLEGGLGVAGLQLGHSLDTSGVQLPGIHAEHSSGV